MASFNPRTREGCDRLRHHPPQVLLGFNPRTREGCDNLLLFATTGNYAFQSTHPRRVRQAQNIKLESLCEFQSTHPRRVRPKKLLGKQCLGSFQSTHPRRVRPGPDNNYPHLLQFQSTHPRRVRHGSWSSKRQEANVSIHAPAKGATL